MPAEIRSTLGSKPTPTIGLPASSWKPFSGIWSGRWTLNSRVRMKVKNLPSATNWSSPVFNTPTMIPAASPAISE